MSPYPPPARHRDEGHALRGALPVVVCVCLTIAATAAHAAERGQAEVALQGYLLENQFQPLSNSGGAALRFSYLSSRYGLLHGSFEGTGGDGHFRRGDNFIEVAGVPWRGSRWTLGAGDLRMPLSITGYPFENLYYPEVSLRGLKLEIAGRKYRYRVFSGRETLVAGPRVTFRIDAPQRTLGATAERQLGRRLHISAIWMRLCAVAPTDSESLFFVPPNRNFEHLNRVGLQALYMPSERLRIFAEGSASQAVFPSGTSRGSGASGSLVSGFAYESRRFVVKSNYSRQSAFYLPVAGYFLGDREGPYAELRTRLHPRFELFASSSRNASNLDRDERMPAIRSWAASSGLTATLPFRISATGQVSFLNYRTRSAAEPERRSDNRQVSVALARPIQRHTLRLTTRSLNLNTMGPPDRQRSAEIEDTFAWRRWLFGGAARWQQSMAAGQNRQSLFFRGMVRGALGRFSAFGTYESGNDLVNRSVFATNTVRMLGAGASVRLPARWNLQSDAFRNKLVTSLNPESMFVLQTNGFVPTLFLSQLDQWCVYFRLGRHFSWGGAAPMLDRDAFGNENVPLEGSVAGLVHEVSSTGRTPAAGVGVLLDGTRRSVTDAHGKYEFAGVPEGAHAVTLAPDELPADFEAAQGSAANIVVAPQRIARTDFEVYRLLQLGGLVALPTDMPASDIVLELRHVTRPELPPQYTTTDRDGRFGFYNLREGDYTIAIDPGTLPDNSILSGAAEVATGLRIGTPLPPVRFVVAPLAQAPKQLKRVTLPE